MDREFASAAKSREKERKQRVDEARKKLAVEKKKSEMVKIEQERIALVTTQRRVEEAAAREAAEAQAQAEQELTGGITFCQVLTAVPISSEGERIVLPPSALQTLETQSALDVAKPLGFEVCALDSTGAVVSKTHCGVLEFTAEEGTVGVPPAAALSLTKEAGVGALRDCRIRVKFVKLATPPKSFIRLQPRGHGFHTNGEDVVNLDLKAVLERELSRHTAVTKGDWIAIRSDKTTYELVVVDLEPCSALALTSTDLEVDLLPSESAVAAAEERELKKREAEQAQEKVAAAALLAVQAEAERRAKVVAAAEAAKASLPPEPDAASSSSSCSAELSGRVVNVLVRLPSGAQLSRRFRQTDPLAALFSFVASEKQVCEDLALAATDFALNMNYPKKSFTLEDCAGSAEAEAGGSGSGPTLGGAGLTGRREALFLQDLTPSPREADEDLQVAAREVASAPAAMEDDDDGHGSMTLYVQCHAKTGRRTRAGLAAAAAAAAVVWEWWPRSLSRRTQRVLLLLLQEGSSPYSRSSTLLRPTCGRRLPTSTELNSTARCRARPKIEPKRGRLLMAMVAVTQKGLAAAAAAAAAIVAFC